MKFKEAVVELIKWRDVLTPELLDILVERLKEELERERAGD